MRAPHVHVLSPRALSSSVSWLMSAILAEVGSGTHPLGEVMLRHSYELHPSAPEEDPLQQRKDSLLADCALDGPLFLTADVLCEVCCARLAVRAALLSFASLVVANGP